MEHIDGQASALVKRLYRYLDASDVAGVCSLLAEDVRWRRGTSWLNGAAECESMLRERATDRTTRHLVLNDVEQVTNEGVRVEYSLLVYAADNAAMERGERARCSLLDCTDDLRREGGDLRFTRRDPRTIFASAAMTPSPATPT